MAKSDDLFTARKSLDEICTIPDRIISVYSLEKHVWADSNSPDARKNRKPELQTIHEFQIDPVRPFLNDILRNMAAPYKPEKRDTTIGQGYWIQAEFGSGKSHVLSFLSALALGSKQTWDIVAEKEKKAGRGKRDSLYRFWEEGLEAKSGKGKKGIFVIVKTLVGTGSGTIGMTDHQGRRMSEYILDAAKEQLQHETGKNVSLYPSELLADRFLTADLERYRNDLKKFLKDPKYFEEDEIEDIADFIRDIQQNKTPEYKKSCGNKLWRFYTEYLQVQPHIAAETEEILKHLVETILEEGYSGVLLVLDEVSLFMKNRSEDMRTDDEKTLVVLSNRLAKIYNLPIWTVCAAQQAIEGKMGVKNIIADDRLKLVKLLEEDKDYYEIVLARVREIKDSAAIGAYYLHYKRGFSWPNSIGEAEFRHFFPFHKPALEVLRAITYELTTARSAIHFMHQTLKNQVKQRGKDLIRLWELFDEAMQYQEDPSGVHAGLVAIKTRRADEYRAYEECKRQIDSLTKGYLKVHRDKGLKTVQTLFLYHIAKTRQQGLNPEEIANSVLIERENDSNVDENIQHYEQITESLKKELRQIVHNFDEDKKPRYRFDPVFTGVDPRVEFHKARDEAEANELMRQEAWDHLLALDEWPVKTRQMTIDLASGVKSIFRDIAPFAGGWEDPKARHGDQTLELVWQGRQIEGLVSMRDLARLATENLPLPAINTDQTDWDFAVFISTKSVAGQTVTKLLGQRKDPRVVLWCPGELNTEEQDRLLNFAAYRKLVSDWQGKDTEDAMAVINWVANNLQTEMGGIAKIVDTCYARGRVDALNHSEMDFHVAGELTSIVSPLVDKVLNSTYESRDISFEPPFIFRKEEGVKVINGIVKTGSIPKGAKPNQNINAAQNFGFGLKIMKKSAEKQLDCSGNSHVQDVWKFIDQKLSDEGQSMKMETIYKNFMGIGGPKDYGLTRRMIQLFLLCLAREGKIRINAGPKSGLAFSVIDYSNLASIDFAVKVLDSLTEIQKVAKPENWEVLRPYAEKLLGKEIPVTHDEAVIAGYRSELLTLFAKEKDEGARLIERSKTLFEALKAANPYIKELEQIAALFSTDVTGNEDINRILYALKTVLGYQAFDKNSAYQTEVDDLANRLKNYNDVKRFVSYESELVTAAAYCAQLIPDDEKLRIVQKEQRKLSKKMAGIQPYIDSEVKLKTELIGKVPPDPGESGTLSSVIKEYTTAYAAMHDSVTERTEKASRAIQDLLECDDFRALKILEKITALQPPISDQLAQEFKKLGEAVFTCPSPSRGSVEEQLKRTPQHECGLSFQNAADLVKKANSLAYKAKSLFDAGFNSKMEVFLNPAVRSRLEQGKSEDVILKILAAKDVGGVRAVMVKACLDDSSIVDVINRYLKQIIVKTVKLTAFKPSMGTVEKGQIPDLAKEFQQFLEKEIAEVDKGGQVLPMLQIE